MWVLLSETKRKCWRIWLAIPGLVISLSLFQTFNGKLDGAIALAWIVIGLMVLPGFLIIYLAMLLDRQTTRFIPKHVSLVLRYGTLLYLLLVLMNFLAETAVVAFSSISMYEYRLQSLIWTLPAEGLLLAGYFLIFFKKQALFQPDENAIKAIASQQAEKWGKQYIELKEKCLELISKAEIQEAMTLYKNDIQKTGIGDLNTLILLEGQLHENQQKMTLGLISPEDSQRTQNRIMLALIQQLEVA